jgi:hypothetical protein
MARTVSDSFPSKYFKADDLKGRRLALTIEKVVDETLGTGRDAREKPVVYFTTHTKGLVLNKTNADIIALVAGSEDFDEWTRTKIVLYPTTTRDPKGAKVACIRVVEPGNGPDDALPDDDDVLAALTPSKKAS